MWLTRGINKDFHLRFYDMAVSLPWGDNSGEDAIVFGYVIFT